MQYIGSGKIMVSVKVPDRAYDSIRVLQTTTSTVRGLIKEIFDILELEVTECLDRKQCRLAATISGEEFGDYYTVYLPEEYRLCDLHFIKSLSLVYKKEEK